MVRRDEASPFEAKEVANDDCHRSITVDEEIAAPDFGPSMTQATIQNL
jgi:hypothetical protein